MRTLALMRLGKLTVNPNRAKRAAATPRRTVSQRAPIR
uniref:Uncharacterized protein n=1 Tax=Klebsiella pneumoniae TaxID=573 RepID=A0A6G8FC36_KLEPN|nr:hypothetical protein [Klebsiella pneumoniae]